MGDISDGAFRRLVDWFVDASGRLLVLIGIIMSGGNNKNKPDK